MKPVASISDNMCFCLFELFVSFVRSFVAVVLVVGYGRGGEIIVTLCTVQLTIGILLLLLLLLLCRVATLDRALRSGYFRLVATMVHTLLSAQQSLEAVASEMSSN